MHAYAYTYITYIYVPRFFGEDLQCLHPRIAALIEENLVPWPTSAASAPQLSQALGSLWLPGISGLGVLKYGSLGGHCVGTVLIFSE